MSLQLPTILSPPTPCTPVPTLTSRRRSGREVAAVPFPGRLPFWASPFASRLANASGRIEFIIFLIMDWSFASGCSPPRLSATQFPSATDSQCSVRWGLPPHCWCALSGAVAYASRVYSVRPRRHRHSKQNTRGTRMLQAIRLCSCARLDGSAANIFYGLFDRVHGMTDLFKGDAQRQHEDYGVTDRACKQFVASGREADFGAYLVGRTERGSIGTPDLNASNKPGSADLADVWQLLKRLKPLREVLDLWLQTFKDAFAFEYVEIRERRSAPQWISTVAMTVVEGLFGVPEKCREYPLRREGCGQGEISARQPFRDRHKIREHIFMLAGKEFSGPSEPGHHFVENQKDFIFVAPPAQSLEGARGPQPHSSGSLDHRLDDQATDLRTVDLPQIFCRRDASHRKLVRLEPVMEQRNSTETGSTERIAMICILK